MKNKQNYSKARAQYLKNQKRDLTLVWIGRITILVAFLGLWELLSSTGVIDPFFFSSPSRMATTIVSLAQEANLWIHIWTSLYETLIGFILATAIGFILAIALWWRERLRKAIEPYLIILNSLPKIALGPMIILWVGSGSIATIVMCILICVIITTISMLNAFISCDNDKILLFHFTSACKILNYKP